MRKKVMVTCFVFVIFIAAYAMVSKVIGKKSQDNNTCFMSSASSFGKDEEEKCLNEVWIFRGDVEISRIENCNIKCEIETGGLKLTVYDNNGYSYLDKDKFIPVREEFLSKSGEYHYDFTDMEEGIYSYCITPVNADDEAYFEYTVEFKDDK